MQLTHYRRLVTEGRSIAADRGHSLPPIRRQPQMYFDQVVGYEGYTECRNCGANLTVRTHVAPNQVDLGGDAVAINCKEVNR